MPGPVIEGHAKFEAECAKCHMRFNRAAQSGLCMDCHKPIAADVRAGRGLHGRQKEKTCRACHTEHRGRAAKIAAFEEKRFDHAATELPLRGAHAKVECRACHVAGKKFREAPQACVACHRKDDKHKGNLGPACADCHGESSWKDTHFDHSRTAFPLTGKHVQAACKDCHAGERFKGTPKDCYGCHRADDDAKGHHGRFGQKCAECHSDRAWKPATFDHDRDTKYPLRGKHRQIACDSCHRAPLHTEKLAQACVSCHRKDDTHKGGLGPKCESCHNEASWKKASFDHDKDTTFPLRGRHASAKCESCHKEPAAKVKLPKDCYGCHRADDDAKGHRGRFGEKCAACHDEKAWKPARFEHLRDAHFALRGKHAAIRCDACHRGVLFKDKTPARCVECHQKDDKHRGQLGPQCDTCHSEADWKSARFDHNRSRFPLLGRHAGLECRACHASPAYKDAKTDCVACHAKDDVHKQRLGPKCESCHNARAWRAWDFDHAKTRYPLEGAHRKVECLACHRAAAPAGIRLDMACVACHARDDVHNGQFGARCERCHAVTKFKEVKPWTGR